MARRSLCVRQSVMCAVCIVADHLESSDMLLSTSIAEGAKVQGFTNCYISQVIVEVLGSESVQSAVC